MKNYRQEQATITKEYHVSTTCDVCDREFPRGYGDWGAPQYEILETQISLKEGHGYPEGGDYKKTTLDICPGCIRSLFDELRAKGAKVRQEDVSW